MGYENIILTLYRLDNSDKEIVNFVRMNPVFAVTMPIERGFSALPSMSKDINVPTYVHTVNDLSIYEKLRDNGVFGIYTDYFEANHWVD
jgi:glycerophosphoryl diester phosphodiesterase